MDRCEQDYLAIVERQNELQASIKPHTANTNKDLWVETKNPDGTKWYIPNQEKLDCLAEKKNGRQCKQNSIFSGKFLRFVFVSFIVCTLFLGCCFLKNEFEYQSKNGGLFNSFFENQRSLKNGIGMNTMATTLFDIREEQTETLIEFVSSGYSFSDEEIEIWKTSISEDLKTIENLSYHRSYFKVVDGYVSLLETLNTYIVQMESGDRQSARLTLEKYNLLISGQKYILAEALEKNGVSHSVREDGISFSYYVY